MHIIASEKKATKSGTGEYLKLEMEIISGDFKGHKVWTNLNLENPSQSAVDIAQKELATICRAVNVLNPKYSENLHKIPFIGSVGIKPAEGRYPESNTMTNYAPYIPSDSVAANSSDGGKPDFLKDEKSTSEEEFFDIFPAKEDVFAEDDIPL